MMLYYCPLDTCNHPIKTKLNLIPIVSEFKDDYFYITNDDNFVYWKTNNNAPNHKIIRMDLKNFDEKNWVDIVAENDQNVLDFCQAFDNDKLITVYIKDVTNIVEMRNLKDGSLIKQFNLPIVSVHSLTGKKNQSEIFFYLSSFTLPGIIYRFDCKEDEEPNVIKM